jgi:hypothetical protein
MGVEVAGDSRNPFWLSSPTTTSFGSVPKIVVSSSGTVSREKNATIRTKTPVRPEQKPL